MPPGEPWRNTDHHWMVGSRPLWREEKCGGSPSLFTPWEIPFQTRGPTEGRQCPSPLRCWIGVLSSWVGRAIKEMRERRGTLSRGVMCGTKKWGGGRCGERTFAAASGNAFVAKKRRSKKRKWCPPQPHPPPPPFPAPPPPLSIRIPNGFYCPLPFLPPTVVWRLPSSPLPPLCGTFNLGASPFGTLCASPDFFARLRKKGSPK